ncbi:MAG: galactokinase family protein [Acidobacteriota bacterium]|nr:galactokinase family protein [Acidobacteriota bacterium]
MNSSGLRVSSPGRVCLLGEHQDYFGLAIIAAAIDLRISIAGTPRADDRIVIDMPDMGEREELTTAAEMPYDKPRDYLKSAVNIHRRAGLPMRGWDCRITSTIPINAGTSSSSAMVVAWNKFLLEAAGDPRAADPRALAELGFETEVAEFKEPGGRMDHYASAFGGVVWIRFDEPMLFDRLRNPLGTFVLADSMQKKDTTGTLGFIKSRVLAGAARVAERIPGFNLKSPLTDESRAVLDGLPDDERRLLLGTLLTRDLTRKGADLFQAPAFDHRCFGEMLTAQHAVLRDHLRISTDKIEVMIKAALDAGALGAKINGSGGGGCMFAYAPVRPDRVAAAVAEAGGRPFIVRVDEGARRES